MGNILRSTLVVVIAAMISAPLPAQPPDETARNRAVIREFHDLINRGEWRKAAELFAPDIVHVSGTSATGSNTNSPGMQDRLNVLSDIYTTFPDFRMEIAEMVAEGDTVIARCRVSGTHRGMGKLNVNGGYLVGVPPTAKHFEIIATHGYQLRDGKITLHMASRDDLGMTRQLGLLPPPGTNFSAATTAGLTRLSNDWDTAIVARDEAAIAGNMAEDFRQIDGYGNLETKKSFVAGIIDPRLVIDPYTVEDFEIRLYGDTALLSGRTHMTGKYDGKPFESNYRYIDIYVRRDGAWKIVSVQITKFPKPDAAH